MERCGTLIAPAVRNNMNMGGHIAHKIDILPTLKGGDSSDETLMPERENVTCRVNISLVKRTALHAPPFSYSKTGSTFRTAASYLLAARASLGGIGFIYFFKLYAGVLALVLEHGF